jgi:hypothetical protein
MLRALGKIVLRVVTQEICASQVESVVMSRLNCVQGDLSILR